MENALLVGLSRQMVLGRAMDVVANNIANMNTTGFKADNAMFEEYLMPVARENRFSPADQRVSFVNDRGAWHNLSGGALQQTGNPLDIAIDGDAFIAVQTAAGERYTRSGALKINSAGVIVTALQAAMQNVPLVMPVFISKWGEATPVLASSSTNGIPPHYLKQNQGAEPWRTFINGDGSINVPRAPGSSWGPPRNW